MAASSPEQKVELTRSTWAAYNRGDLEAVLANFHSDLVVEVPAELANAGTFRGHDGFLQWVATWNEAWESFELEVIDTVAVGDRHVVSHMRQTGVGRGSGIEVSQQMGWLFDVDDENLTAYISLHPSYEDALEAAREREGSAD